MRVVSLSPGMRRYTEADYWDELAHIDWTGGPGPSRRRRRRRSPPDEEMEEVRLDVRHPELVSDRNPHGTHYVQGLIGLVDSGIFEVSDADRPAPERKRAGTRVRGRKRR